VLLLLVCVRTPGQPRAAPVFGPFRGFVETILAEDETAPRKQRHTATQVYRRLVAEHSYTGGYDQVRRYLKRRRAERRETFERDRAASLPLPERPFDACVEQPAQVDKYQTVRFDNNSYSVPRRWAFRPVSVKGYVDRVVVVADGQVIARHRRSYGRGEKVLDPLHYLVVLERKPAALDHAPVYRDWQLPPAFAALRQSLATRLGPAAGARHYIRVLQLLGHHPVPGSGGHSGE
jgi:hypothetical protein